MPYLLNIPIQNPKLRANPDFVKLFEKELFQRFFFREDQKVEDPRFSYRHWTANLPFDFFAKDLQKEQREALKVEQTKVKQMIVERNRSFHQELVKVLMNPVNVLPQ